jgi:hypothetical protein
MNDINSTTTGGSGRKPMIWLAVGTLIGVGVCVFCALAFFIFQEINASIKETALDEQCYFHDTDLTDAECDVWVERVTSDHRQAFMECSGKGTSEDVYLCLVDKGLGP